MRKRKNKPNPKKLKKLIQIIDEETKYGSISINQLHKLSEKYTKTKKRISRDTISSYARFFGEHVIFNRRRGREGVGLISKKNFERLQNTKGLRKEWAHKVYLKTMKEFEPIFKRASQRVSRISNTVLRLWIEQVSSTFIMALEKALEYVPKDKKWTYLHDIEKIFLQSKSKYEIEDHGDTLVLRDRETGLMHPSLIIHKEE